MDKILLKTLQLFWLNYHGDHEILISRTICLIDVRTNVDRELWTEYVKFTIQSEVVKK